MEVQGELVVVAPLFWLLTCISGVPIEEYVHYTHGYAQTKDANYGRDFGGFCQEEFVDHCLFHEYDEIVCHVGICCGNLATAHLS